MEDIFNEVIKHQTLLDLLRNRQISITINKNIIAKLRTILALYTGLIVTDYTVEELIYLSKRYIIKAGIFTGFHCSYVVSDAVTSLTTISQVFTSGRYNILAKNSNVFIPIANLYDVRRMSRSCWYASTTLLITTIEGKASFYSRDEYGKVISKPLDYRNISEIAVVENNIFLLQSNQDLYHILGESSELIYRGIWSISAISPNRILLIGNDKQVYVYDIKEMSCPKVILNNGKNFGLIAIKSGWDCYILLNDNGELILDYKEDKVIAAGVIDFVKLDSYLIILTRTGKLVIKNKQLKDIYQMSGVLKIAGIDDYALILTTDEKVYGFGANQYGQLGTGDKISRDLPTLVMDLKA